MKKIVFVCLGKICRSPMAEAVLRELIKEKGLSDEIQVESRATSHWEEGKPPHPGTQKKLKEHGIDFDGIRSEQIKTDDFTEFDLIVGLDKENVADLVRISPRDKTEKIHLFLSVLPDCSYEEVPDPYYTNDFDLTYDLVRKGSEKWLSIIEKM